MFLRYNAVHLIIMAQIANQCGLATNIPCLSCLDHDGMTWQRCGFIRIIIASVEMGGTGVG